MIETASWSRRILALLIDWFASIGVVMLFLGPAGWLDNPAAGTYTLGVFVAQSTFLVALAGGSFGQLATQLRVIRHDGTPRPLDLLRALVRQVLVALVIPPLVFRPDGRGLHDMAVGSAVVRLQDLRGPAR
ncbi:RDD family protein [Nocardioides sp. Y6]|uniref:RDD family protein n=1 Tax=Nocardioides malaquae TaxID=2773426 RepID=A0ABR9RVS0_9ACTN|nr:RDD family protein [Nocardioides malaquae]MBE7325678.1 RDD family protein [Nocardioides malaquae]